MDSNDTNNRKLKDLKVSEWHVVWEINVRAATAHDAAVQAMTIQRDPDSLATVFDVIGDDGESVRIDLLERCFKCGQPLGDDRFGLRNNGQLTHLDPCPEVKE